MRVLRNISTSFFKGCLDLLPGNFLLFLSAVCVLSFSFFCFCFEWVFPLFFFVCCCCRFFFKLDALERLSVKDMQMFLFQSSSSTSGKLQSVELVDKAQFILVYCIFLMCSVDITQGKSRTRDQMLWYFSHF